MAYKIILGIEHRAEVQPFPTSASHTSHINLQWFTLFLLSPSSIFCMASMMESQILLLPNGMSSLELLSLEIRICFWHLQILSMFRAG
jgi:hypothetical protein